MADQARARKVADRIKSLVAEYVEFRLKDERVGFLTITDVRVTGDLQNASVFYTVFGSDEERAATAGALADNKGAWLLLWPHVRPWRLRAAQPMLRGIPDAAAVAARLAELLGGKPTPAALAVMPSAAQRPARQAASAAAAA